VGKAPEEGQADDLLVEPLHRVEIGDAERDLAEPLDRE
jgi:hypothetical protein